MPKNVFHFAMALSLLFALFGKAQAYRYRRARDFLPGTTATATGAPTEATFLTIGSELMEPETKEVVPVRLRIYDAAGKLVKTLVSGTASPGFYRVFWDGKDNRNKSVASGIYFYRLALPQKALIRKAILLR